MALKSNKRGQVTIFIIIAVVVIAFIVFAYVVYPKIKASFETDTKNPQAFIAECVEDELNEYVDLISVQGGSLEPAPIYLYEGNSIQYLCYTNQNYEACTMQNMLLETNIEKELTDIIAPQVGACFNSLKSNYEKKGYIVQIKPGETKIELLPKKIIGTFDYEVVLTKDGTETYNLFSIMLNNNLYELIKISDVVVGWSQKNVEDIDPLIIMEAYHFIDMTVNERTDGTIVYKLKDDETGGEFDFAIRSWVLPGGF